jgi:hypothetical protein
MSHGYALIDIHAIDCADICLGAKLGTISTEAPGVRIA